MRVADFDYNLPEELIAQTPLKDRTTSRLLVLNKQTGNYVKVRQSLYAHRECAEAEAARTKTEDEILENYICNLLSLDFLSPRIKKQITQYKNQYHYTANGILKALVYFYEVKNNDIKKSNDGIGIVPYVYLEAFNYYYALWQAQ